MRFDNVGIDMSADMRLDMRIQAEEFHRELSKYLQEKGVSTLISVNLADFDEKELDVS